VSDFTPSSAVALRPAPRRGIRVLFSFVALVLAPFSWYWTIDHPALRATGMTAWMMLASALFLALSAAAVDRRWWVRGVAVFQVAAAALFVWLFFGFSRMPDTLLAGELRTAPDFTLPDELGRPVSLAATLARGPVLLVFYRGHW